MIIAYIYPDAAPHFEKSLESFYFFLSYKCNKKVCFKFNGGSFVMVSEAIS